MIPQNELGVIVLFSRQAAQFGFEIIEINADYPDALIEKSGVSYRTEFEFMASNFYQHRHDPRHADMIICWENDYPKSILPVLALSKENWHKIEIVLPTEMERELAYWKQRALIAERKARILGQRLKENSKGTSERLVNTALVLPEGLPRIPATLDDFRQMVQTGEARPELLTGTQLAMYANITDRTARNWLAAVRRNGSS